MNHKFHLADQGQTCNNCHEGLFTKDAPTQEESVVKMEYCFQCHDNSTATQYCMLCHVNPVKPDSRPPAQLGKAPRQEGGRRPGGVPEVPHHEGVVPPLPPRLEGP